MSKLSSRTALDHDRRHFKAAKALVIVIPLLGFTYLLTLMGPSEEESFLAFTIFHTEGSHTASLITKSRGWSSWEMWKIIRNGGFECQSAQTSHAIPLFTMHSIVETYHS